MEELGREGGQRNEQTRGGLMEGDEDGGQGQMKDRRGRRGGGGKMPERQIEF